VCVREREREEERERERERRVERYNTKRQKTDLIECLLYF
jgi:hypothetical protein